MQKKEYAFRRNPLFDAVCAAALASLFHSTGHEEGYTKRQALLSGNFPMGLSARMRNSRIFPAEVVSTGPVLACKIRKPLIRVSESVASLGDQILRSSSMQNQCMNNHSKRELAID